MANALGNYNEIFYAQQALIFLKNRLGLTQRCHMGYDQEYKTRNQGDTIAIRGPSPLTVASAPSAAQALTARSVSLVLDTWQEVRYGLTDKDLVLSREKFAADHVRPAAYQLANKVDQALAAAGRLGAPYFYNAAGATLAIADLTGAQQVLFDNMVPMDESNLFGMVGGKEQNDLLANATFATYNGSGPTGEQSQVHGALGIGPRFGINWFASQNRPLHVIGTTLVQTTLVLAANFTLGTNSVSLSAATLTGQIMAGDTITFAGSTQKYIVQATVTASGNAATVSVLPAAVVTHTATTAAVVEQNLTQLKSNLVFHRNFMAVGFGKLPDYDGMNLGAQVSSVVDEETGLAVRFKIYGDHANSAVGYCLDILYGVKVLDPMLAVRLRIA